MPLRLGASGSVRVSSGLASPGSNARFKRPKRYEVVNRLPKNSDGKILER